MKYISFNAVTYLIISVCLSIVKSTANSTALTILDRSRLRRSIETDGFIGVDEDSTLTKQGTVDLPWEQFIVSGPSTINLLGQLMVVSSKLDFSFVEFQPNYPFIYMRYPRSFRATLSQIANDGWQAFLDAHINMYKIQASMELVPKQVQLVMRTLTSNNLSPYTIQKLLSTSLAEIERLGKSCVILANSTHISFVNVMNLIGEVISTTEVTRGLQENALAETEIELNVSRVMQTELNKLGQIIRSHYDETREAVKKAQQEYSKALANIPTGFQALLFDLGRAVVGLVKSAGPIISTVIAAKTGMLPVMMAGSMVAPTTSVASGQALTFGKLFSGSLSKALPRLKEILGSGPKISSILKNPQELDAYKVTFQAFLSSLATGKDSSLKDQATRLIQRGITLVSETAGQVKSGISSGQGVSSNISENLLSRFSQLDEDAKPMAAAETMSGAVVPPLSRSAGQEGDSSENERFAAELSLNRLQSTEQRYDNIFQQLKQNQEDVAKLMGKIASLDMVRIQYKEILELLREALHLLSRVREQWGQLVLFFADIATRAEITLSGTLGPFIVQAAQASSETLTNDERIFYVDILKAQTVDIYSQSQMLHTMSQTYVDMSTNYMMKRLAGLSQLLAAKDDHERNSLLAKLHVESDSTQKAVRDLISQHKSYYQNAIYRRRIELLNVIEDFGGTDTKDTAAIATGRVLLANQ